MFSNIGDGSTQRGMRHEKVPWVHWTHHCSPHSHPSILLTNEKWWHDGDLRDGWTFEMDKVLASFWDLAKGQPTQITTMPTHDWLSIAARVKRVLWASASLSPSDNQPDCWYCFSLLGNLNQVMAWKFTINCLYTLIEISISATFPWGSLRRLEMYQGGMSTHLK